MKFKNVVYLFLIAFTFLINIKMQAQKSYLDDKGRKINVRLGDIAFVDKVVEFYSGEIKKDKKLVNPGSAAGLPDYKNNNRSKYVALGCSGEITFKFTDNYLVDIDGYDIYLFEVGASSPKLISISKDGKKWLNIGKLEKGQSAMDIKHRVKLNDKFSYIKIKDLTSKQECDNGASGLNIDAIVALGALALDGENIVKRELDIQPYLKVWDAQQEDGDVVAISLNDNILNNSLALQQKKAKYEINLKEGKNVIEFNVIEEGKNPNLDIGFEIIAGTKSDYARIRLNEKNSTVKFNIFYNKGLTVRKIY